ncbi:hypothetical protein D9V37_06870 [Nocardioides mangrovicus]|uniref:Uncharacterized protein n=1 Tax=Nocardioides mangrovicus TaxID=2478913 RepID=A0A3L8P2J9_9ACTN|nr:hypothetical protein [Nocardioides mangrovicus]RLV49636.1 hypothetical protein D9V37_06870 [Nocardioides mangrovicus]
MSEQQPERIDADITPDDSVDGTATGNPVAGVQIDEQEAERAVEPDDNSALEVDGPQQSHP